MDTHFIDAEMKKNNFTPTLLILIVLISACNKMNLCKDQNLSFHRTDYTGQEIRIDGFWYGPGREDFEGTISHSMLCLYKNGVLYWVGSPQEPNFEEYILFAGSSEVEKLAKTTKYIWGVFSVDSNLISLSYWNARPCGYHSILQSGEVLNDTTFVLTEKQTTTDSETRIEAVNEIYRFRQFDQKPDSTNNFIH